MYDRRLRDIVNYAHGEKIQDFHIPTDVNDYRAIYRAYLHDPDLQDARARWPFVNMWDNHEFSWKGWQSLQNSATQHDPRKRAKWRRTRHFLNISRRVFPSQAARRSTLSNRRRWSMPRHQFR